MNKWANEQMSKWTKYQKENKFQFIKMISTIKKDKVNKKRVKNR